MTKKLEGYTPGPWVAVGSGSGDMWSIHRTGPGIDGAFFCSVSSMHYTEEARSIAEANARLIAAAPEMLELLQDIYETVFVDQEHSPIANRTEKLIQKIRGEL